MLSTDKRARAVCEAMAKHEGVAWVGMALRGRKPEGPGEVVGYACVRRTGSLGHDGGLGWWCVYLGVCQELQQSLNGIDVHGGVTWPWKRRTPIPGLPDACAGLVWAGWEQQLGAKYSPLVL